MKILIVNPLLGRVFGGAEMNDLKLAEAMYQQGHEVSVARVKATDDGVETLPNYLKIIEIDQPYEYGHASRQKGLKGKLSRARFFRKFARLIGEQYKASLDEQDLILLTGRSSLGIIGMYTSTPVVLSVRGPIGDNYFIRRVNEHFIKKAHALIFWGGCQDDVDEEPFNSLPKLYLDPAVEDKYFYKGKFDPELRLSLQAGCTDTIVMTFVGRLEAVKQVDYIIRSVKYLVQEGFLIRLIIVGDGALKEQLEEIADGYCPGSISFLGRKDSKEIADILRATDISIMYSKIENHPISLKEAVACGAYAVSSNVGRSAKILSDPLLGMLVEPDSQESLNEGLKHLLENKLYAGPKSYDDTLGMSWNDNAMAIIGWSKTILPSREKLAKI